MSTPARAAADAYIARVNARDLDGLVELFAPEALLFAAGGQRLQGKEQIRAFYEGTVLVSAPSVRGVHFVHQEATCVMELEATTPAAPDLTARLVDVLTVGGDGRIVRLAIYMQLNP
jgi:ketosteroid isomerase-like protein